jgi:hypothetical protein
MLFWVLAALAVVGALAIVWGLYLLARRWLSSEPGAGVDTQKTSPARKWRARGRIEHTLLVGDGHPNRPKTFARNHTIPQKPQMFLFTTKGRGITWSYPGSCIWTSENSSSTHFGEYASSRKEGRLLAVLFDTRSYDHLARTLEAFRSLELA